MMWAFVAIAATELAVVHVLVAMWSWRVAFALSAVTFGSILWLVGVIRSFERLPVQIADGQLLMRVGTLKQAKTPLGNLAGLAPHWDAAMLKQRDLINLALIAYPNVVVLLRQPVAASRGRMVSKIAHRLDDPHAFAAALESLGQGDD
jgi:hypothetical protein